MKDQTDQIEVRAERMRTAVQRGQLQKAARLSEEVNGLRTGHSSRLGIVQDRLFTLFHWAVDNYQAWQQGLEPGVARSSTIVYKTREVGHAIRAKSSAQLAASEKPPAGHEHRVASGLREPMALGDHDPGLRINWASVKGPLWRDTYE